MLNVDVEAQLQGVHEGRALVVRAFVAAGSPRPLRWRLITSSRSAGGVSDVTQSGTTQGLAGQPVSIVTLSPGSRGTVVLVVLDGPRELARDTLQIEDVTGTGDRAGPDAAAIIER